MAEIDTSSYPKATTTNPLDTIAKVQTLESNKIGIDQNKLKLANERYGILNKELSTLISDPDVNPDKIIKSSQNLVTMGLIPPDMHAKFISQIPTNQQVQKDPNSIRTFLERTLTRTMDTQAAINFHYGAPGLVNTGAGLQPVVSSPKTGIRSTGPVIPAQIPPTTTELNNNNEPQLHGVQSPVSTPSLPAAPPLTVPGPQTSQPSVLQNRLPVTGDTTLGGANQSVNPLPVRTIPVGPRTGLAPGVGEATVKTGIASGEQLAIDRQHASNFQRDVFPLEQAIPALEKLGTKGTGPGTETINHLKSFVLSNIPGVKESDFNGTVADYDKAKKYLTDFVNQTGNSGTNDKLAAAFAGNPSVGISNAAAIDVAKSALALRRMKQAQLLEFEKTGLRDDQYSKWLANRTNELDARAFGVDLMSNDAKKKLLAQLNKNPIEKKRFEGSLQIAHDLQFVTPSGH